MLFYQGYQVVHVDPVVLGILFQYTHNRAPPFVLYRIKAWQYFLRSHIFIAK